MEGNEENGSYKRVQKATYMRRRNPPRDRAGLASGQGPPCGRGKGHCLSAAFGDQGGFWSDSLRAVHGAGRVWWARDPALSVETRISHWLCGLGRAA